MRLTLTTFLSFDGVYQGPGGPKEDTRGGFAQGGWTVPYFNDELGDYMNGIFEHADGFVLGRRTYEIFAGAWPRSTGDDPVTVGLNTLPKHVASRTLDRVEWTNSRLIAGDVVAGVAELKEQPGRELQIHGSGALAQTLLDAGLIDTFRFIVFPVVLGSGLRLLPEGRTPTGLELEEVKTTKTGVTMQTFTLAGPPSYGEFELAS